MPVESDPPIKLRRRWKRWVFGFLILSLVGGLVWLNGPGARLIADKVILQQLGVQKLSGSFKLEGTLLKGLSLHDIDLTGESKIQKVEADLLKIEWSIPNLIEKKVDAIILERLHLVIDPKAPPLPPKEDEGGEEEKDSKALEKTLELVRGLLRPSQISITDIEVEVRETATVSLQSLSHTPGTDAYLFEEFSGIDHLDRPIRNPRSTLTWSETGLALDQFTILPTLSIRDLNFAPGGELTVDVLIDESKLSVASDLAKNHSIVLKSPKLEIKKAAELYDPELPAGGAITALEIDTSKGFVNIQGENLQWDEQKLENASIEARAEDLTQPFEEPIKIKIALADMLDVEGTVKVRKEILDSEVKVNFTLRYPEIPTVTGTLDYASREVDLVANALDGVRVEGTYFVESSTYEARASADLPDASVVEKRLTGPLRFAATGSGSIPDKTHVGKLDLDSLSLQAPNLPTAVARGEIEWNWPENVTVKRLQLDSPEGQLQAELGWRKDVLTIERISLIASGAQVLSVAGKFPAPLEFESLEAYLDSDAPVELKVKSQPLTFTKLATFAPLPDSLRGVTQADLSLAGSLATPQLDGFVTVDDFRIATKPDVPPASIRLNFKTENQQLLLTASAKEPGGPLLDVKGDLPFLPRAWLDRKKSPKESPLNLRAYSPELDLRRIKPFVPAITSINGTLKLDMRVAGNLAKPDYGGTATIRVKRMRLADSPISDIRDASIDIRVNGKLITIDPSSVSASGGSVKLGGTVDLAGTEPVLNLSLNGNYLLLSRNADYTFRGNPNLRLRGPFSSASITGSLGIVESLFFKDVEILPFGVPRTTDIPRPTLPSFTPPPTLSGTDKSGGFKGWTLNIDVTTQDPILVRGNLADGKIVGAVKVFGTVGNPKTSGTLTSQDLVADLPFSDLQVQSALITLRPDALTDPFVNVRGSSSVGQYTVQVYVTGSVQSPNLLLTSNPPLPENEIMLLLATGSASAQLQDRQVASQKALQYLLEGIRRRNGDKDKTVFQRLLKNSDQIELSLGDTDQFSGRQFSSASLGITDRFDFTTQIDENGETRALVVFSIRFK